MLELSSLGGGWTVFESFFFCRFLWCLFFWPLAGRPSLPPARPTYSALPLNSTGGQSTAACPPPAVLRLTVGAAGAHMYLLLLLPPPAPPFPSRSDLVAGRWKRLQAVVIASAIFLLLPAADHQLAFFPHTSTRDRFSSSPRPLHAADKLGINHDYFASSTYSLHTSLHHIRAGVQPSEKNGGSKRPQAQQQREAGPPRRGSRRKGTCLLLSR